MDNEIVDPGKKYKMKLKAKIENKINFFNKFKKLANKLIIKIHNSDKETLYKKIANDIVYNEKSHVVAVFKDYLIYDDSSEFLKR